MGGVIVLMGLALGILYSKHENVAVQLTEANLKLGRAKTSIASEIEAKDKFSADVRKEISARKALQTMYGELEARLAAKGSGKVTVERIYVPGEKIVVYKKDGSQEELKNYPFKYSDFRLKVVGDAITRDFSYDLLQRFRMRLIETKTADNQISHYAELYEINNDTKAVVNKLDITAFEIVKLPAVIDQLTFKLIDLKVDIQALVMTNAAFDIYTGFDLGVSLSSYGKYKDPLFRFVRLGVGGNSEGVLFTASPLQLNIAKSLPVFHNIWLSPNIIYQRNINNLMFGLGIGATL
jgi:hypothetical protein